MSEPGDKATPAPVVATIALTQQDLVGGLVEMSAFYRARSIILALLVLVNVFAWRTGRLASREAVVAQVVTFMGLAVFAFLAPWLTARRQLQAMTASGDANVTYRFDERGVTIRSAAGESTVAYANFVNVRRGKTALLLYTTAQIASIVPLRAFTQDELERVMAMMPSPRAAARP